MGWMPGVKQEPVPSHSGPMVEHRGLVLHVQVGNGDCYGEFDNPYNEASSTWWIAKDGTIVQYMDSDLTAWTEMAGNPLWDSVETEGEPSEALTDAQVLSLARIYIFGVRLYGWPLQLSEDPNTHGLGWHGMGGAAWGGHFGCPGDLRKPQRAAALFLAYMALNPKTGTTVPPADQETTMQAKSPLMGFITVRPDASVYAEAGAEFHGSAGRVDPTKPAGPGNEFTPSAPIVACGFTKSGHGYWLLGADGAVYAFGDANSLGFNHFKNIPAWGIGAGTSHPLVGISDNDAGGFYIVADNPTAPAPSLYNIVVGTNWS